MAFSTSTDCPLCSSPDRIIDIIPDRPSTFLVDCDICGRFIFNHAALLNFRDYSEEQKALLSAYTFDSREHKLEPPDLSVPQGVPHSEIFSRYARKHALEKLNNLVLYLGNHSQYFKQPFKLHKEKHYPITFSTRKEEFSNIKDQAIAERLAEMPSAEGNITLSLTGWERYEALKSSTLIETKQCFVAMSFKPTLNELYESGIRPAIIDAGYDPVRVDRKEHNEKICDLIIAEIRRSRFVVADFTRQRQGVYYEAGFALGLGRPVIFLCAKKEEKRVHFDTRQYNHIFWETPLELREKLKSRIEATIA